MCPQCAGPTLYSGSCWRKKQARTSSQWKVPLWVPIFFGLMFSVRVLLGWLDMCLCSSRGTCADRKQQLVARELKARETQAGLFEMMWDVKFIKVNVIVRKRLIQNRRDALTEDTFDGRTGSDATMLWTGETAGNGHVCLLVIILYIFKASPLKTVT